LPDQHQLLHVARLSHDHLLDAAQSVILKKFMLFEMSNSMTLGDI
jgi:hypothetical protein